MSSNQVKRQSLAAHRAPGSSTWQDYQRGISEEKLRELLCRATQNGMSSGGWTGKEPGIPPSRSFLPEGRQGLSMTQPPRSSCLLHVLYTQPQVLDTRGVRKQGQIPRGVETVPSANSEYSGVQEIIQNKQAPEEAEKRMIIWTMKVSKN